MATPAGNQYRLLALPLSHTLSLSALERIESYVKQGGNIVGLPPLGPTGQVDEKTRQRYARWPTTCGAAALRGRTRMEPAASSVVPMRAPRCAS